MANTNFQSEDAQILSTSDPPVIPTTPNEEEGDVKRRKRGCNSEFYDLNDSATSNFAPIAPIAPRAVVPLWTMCAPPTTGFHGGTIFMIPPCGATGPTICHQPQLWAIPTGATPVLDVPQRPISNYISAMKPVVCIGGSAVDTPAVSSGSISTTRRREMVKDLSLEIGEKRELQFMEGCSTDKTPMK
ncbi:hypothetical protein Ccrd_016925 [Cynara cardunculus var. scolymus]|uniref:Uncharacterized protein n=1 Tax=Cynara cardunculus var. scolymus TaxID=59895 RepID=A0A103Y909_CYNCS|nr:hypothetical protein Ccrd_016925 [Cynara cardunculus var. scolymus]